MQKAFLIISIIFTTYSFVVAQSLQGDLNKVRKIKPLKANIEKVLEALAEGSLNYSAMLFPRPNSVISVSYSRGNCAEDFEDWNVSGGLVTQISVSSKDFIEVKTVKEILGINSKLRKERIWGKTKRRYVYHDKKMGIAIVTHWGDVVSQVIFSPSKNNYSLLCNKKEVKRYYSGRKWNRYAINKKNYYDYNHPANVTELNLSQSEVYSDCHLSGNKQKKNHFDQNQKINISVSATDFENDVLTYNYRATGGKIVGRGASVDWDLSGVKPGVYSITAIADDGCGFCGKWMTKEVVVKESPDCSKK